MPNVLMAAETSWPSIHELLFITLPYGVVALFLFATIRRFRGAKFTYSSYSSQFLENRHQFFGAVPWHYGIIALFFGHLIGFLFPSLVLWGTRYPIGLYIIELGALIFAFVALFGMANALIRRLTNPRITVVTTRMDWIILLMLLVQVMTGIWVATSVRWGSQWFAAVLSPYLWSLFTFRPDVSGVSMLPLAVKIHILGAFAIFALFPFTRLVHLLVVPIPYIWRKVQVVVWNRKTGSVRD